MNTDDVLSAAIRDKQCLTGLYDGAVRHFAPHALGTAADGCFHLDRLSHLRLNEHRWRSRSNYSLKRQTCLATVTAGLPISA